MEEKNIGGGRKWRGEAIMEDALEGGRNEMENTLQCRMHWRERCTEVEEVLKWNTHCNRGCTGVKDALGGGGGDALEGRINWEKSCE